MPGETSAQPWLSVPGAERGRGRGRRAGARSGGDPIADADRGSHEAVACPSHLFHPSQKPWNFASPPDTLSGMHNTNGTNY